MTLEELKEKEKLLQIDFNSKLGELRKGYAKFHNKYEIGNIFTDHIGSIIIESIRYWQSENPCCVYYGTELKKDGTPRKDGSKRQAWQSNEKK